MDPITVVGFAANVAQLVDLALAVFTNLHKYSRNFESAPKRSEQLRREVNHVVDLLADLQDIFKKNPNEFLRRSLELEVKELEVLLRELQSRTNPQNTKGFQRLKWPFKEAENEDLIRRIERFKSSFNLAMNISQTYNH
jgi:DNA repair exonuclease SbcCD ATPase subunit